MQDTFYNIMVQTDFATVTGLGLQKVDLEDRVLSHYRRGEAFLLEGTLISPSSIQVITITETTEAPDALAKKAEVFRNSRRYAWLVRPDVAAATRFGRDVTEELLGGPPGHSTISAAAPEPAETDPRTVFVVHGRDGGARAAMFAFLRSLGLKPLEWSSLLSTMNEPSPYIGEVLDHAFSLARAVVVLLTPDDLARLREELLAEEDDNDERQLTGQARPNVLFEAGMALGRRPKQTVLVELGTLRPFSDIAGRHVVRLDGTLAKRQDLATRLLTAGCAVDMTGTDWHTAGDFADIVTRADDA